MTWFELPLREYGEEPEETVPIAVLVENDMVQDILEAAKKQIG